jgi:hypothetical protein
MTSDDLREALAQSGYSQRQFARLVTRLGGRPYSEGTVSRAVNLPDGKFVPGPIAAIIRIVSGLHRANLNPDDVAI